MVKKKFVTNLKKTTPPPRVIDIFLRIKWGKKKEEKNKKQIKKACVKNNAVLIKELHLQSNDLNGLKCSMESIVIM